MDHVSPRLTVFSAKPLQVAGDPAVTLAAVARHLLPHLEQGRRIDALKALADR